ncbi:hypothetical protein L9F63_017283 [Diploptera punctata]|uniref:Uncharacterized protein n=1 Tax=Diploptera punctata TaxID=6984 RepID=A0AAD7ZZ40_DIPPU|nr:hypothetical protein L9F63_017283 [Diploptera punctata]
MCNMEIYVLLVLLSVVTSLNFKPLNVMNTFVKKEENVARLEHNNPVTKKVYILKCCGEKNVFTPLIRQSCMKCLPVMLDDYGRDEYSVPKGVQCWSLCLAKYHKLVNEDGDLDEGRILEFAPLHFDDELKELVQAAALDCIDQAKEELVETSWSTCDPKAAYIGACIIHQIIGECPEELKPASLSESCQNFDKFAEVVLHYSTN